MITETTYNGWANYATWRINLELIDGLEIRDNFREKPEVDEVANYLKNMVDDYLSECGSGIALDYARSFVFNVNYREIAKHLIEAAEYEEDES